MQALKIVFKAIALICLMGFSCNLVLQFISYAFYKRAKQITRVTIQPVKIQINDALTGYGCHLETKSNKVIILLGGSNYIAYNTIGRFGGYYNCPVLSVDYYGTQESLGKMNLQTMQRSVTDLYDWAKAHYPESQVSVIGHSYGCGMAAYLASVRPCQNLILLAAYRNLADLYNKILPIFWGPVARLITNNIDVVSYAKATKCPVYVIGSHSDRTLSAALQEKVAHCYNKAQLFIYNDITHENYLAEGPVIQKLHHIIGLGKEHS